MTWTRDRFESLYEDGDGDPWGFYESEYERRKYERTIAALSARKPPESVETILDLGCGNGAATKLIAERYPDADVVGVDIAEPALETARERAPEATYERADVVEFVRETDRTFDAVVELECCCYLAADRSVTDLLEFADALRDGLASDGCLVSTHVHMPDGGDPSIEQERTARTVRTVFETAFERVGRERYVDRKRVALDPDEPAEQPYEVWTFRRAEPRTGSAR